MAMASLFAILINELKFNLRLINVEWFLPCLRSWSNKVQLVKALAYKNVSKAKA